MEKSINSLVPIKRIYKFPACLLEKESYQGIKGLMAILFWFFTAYFCYGLINFFCWNSNSLLLELLTKPIYFIYHICIFSFIYSISWVVFDFDSFKECVFKLLGIVAAIVYLCLPTDLIPDLIPLIGHLDDLLAVAFAIYSAVSMGKTIPLKNIKNVKNINLDYTNIAK